MKRLIVCCDGTWNNATQEDNGAPAPTNVFKIHNAIADRGADGSAQLKYYHPGVGGEGGLVKSVVGGAVGAGISRHIRSAYHWLGSNYEEGDDIYLFGFSRGAFTARSLSGLLSGGLLDLRELESAESWRRVEAAYDTGYREQAEQPEWAAADWRFFHEKEQDGGARVGQPAPIRFLGVWDTVGALGVPDDLEILNLLDNPKKWRFHNTRLGANVKTARHAMAIDEVRSCFTVTRWEKAEEHPDATELWFPGVHSDVGGGYAISDLSDGALLWMMDEAETTKLAMRDGVRSGLNVNPLGTMHNSFKGAFTKLRSRPRNVAAMVPENEGLFHAGAFRRQSVSPISHPPYHPTRVLDVGDSCTVSVFADTRWNRTGVYLAAGQGFTFSATGEWLDSKDACGWKGTEDGKLTAGDLIRSAGSFLGNFEGGLKLLTGSTSTDMLGTKRVEDLPWFTLVGAIANDGPSEQAVGNDGSPRPHQCVALPAHETDPLVVRDPGYLYCFPNDVWSLYGNNHGSVQLTIQRVS